jgi:hypothetical protein
MLDSSPGKGKTVGYPLDSWCPVRAEGLFWLRPRRGINVLEAYEARRGTVVRVREGHWKSQFAGMRGTVQSLWGKSEYVAVDVLLEDGRSELFWPYDLEVLDEDIAV